MNWFNIFGSNVDIMYQNKIKLISIDESLRSINYEAKKRKRKNKNFSLCKS